MRAGNLFRRLAGWRESCPLCGQARARIARLGDLAPTQAGAFHVERFGMRHCAECDVLFIEPRPSPKDLGVMYQASDQFSDATYTDPERVSAILDYMKSAVRDRGIMPRTGERVLEIGAGWAWMCRAVKDLEPGVETVAQDVTGEVATRCAWVDRYFVGPMEDLDEAEPFALISLTHVIEHLVEPAAMLARLSKRLGPAGHLFITGPYRPKGWLPSHGLEPWRSYPYLHVPAHVSYLSKTWFEQQAERCGLVLQSWDPTHDDSQAFEAVLIRRESPIDEAT